MIINAILRYTALKKVSNYSEKQKLNDGIQDEKKLNCLRICIYVRVCVLDTEILDFSTVNLNFLGRKNCQCLQNGICLTWYMKVNYSANMCWSPRYKNVLKTYLHLQCNNFLSFKLTFKTPFRCLGKQKIVMIKKDFF